MLLQGFSKCMHLKNPFKMQCAHVKRKTMWSGFILNLGKLNPCACFLADWGSKIVSDLSETFKLSQYASLFFLVVLTFLVVISETKPRYLVVNWKEKRARCGIILKRPDFPDKLNFLKQLNIEDIKKNKKTITLHQNIQFSLHGSTGPNQSISCNVCHESVCVCHRVNPAFRWTGKSILLIFAHIQMFWDLLV